MYDDLFQNVNETTDYNLRGSATRVHIPMPKTEFFKQIKLLLQWSKTMESDT